MRKLLLVAMICPLPAFAGEVDRFETADFLDADIVIIGEIHDDPRHHETQAEIIEMVDPKSVVFEMLTAEQAGLITPDNITSPDLGTVLDWAQSGWPDFTTYAPIFTALDSAVVVGAAASKVESAKARDGIIAAFGADADQFGLTLPLSKDEQATREQGMQDGHCGALPEAMLPWFVDQQRFRDASFSKAALDALAAFGGPVVVITGNGHARTDWGMPVYLSAAAPHVKVLSIGQISESDEATPFNLWRITTPVDRPDPCAVFD
jgi:uncharacterized iron-regulated protein